MKNKMSIDEMRQKDLINKKKNMVIRTKMCEEYEYCKKFGLPTSQEMSDKLDKITGFKEKNKRGVNNMIEKRQFMKMAHHYCNEFTKRYKGNYHVNLGQIMKLMYMVKKSEINYSEFKRYFVYELTLKRETRISIEELDKRIEERQKRINETIIRAGIIL